MEPRPRPPILHLPLPPLGALRAFEAAARHLSFTHAAAELCVTQTAVSHQIRQLEDHLGTRLFRRAPRHLTLTSDGEAWARELHAIFSRLHEVNRLLRTTRRAARPVVAVSVLPSFASRWLVPRLGRFLARHPEIDVRISASEFLTDFAVDPIDIGIRYGLGRYPGLAVDKLGEDAWVVVCSPALRARRRLSSPEDLRRHVLIRDDEPQIWDQWLATNGVRGVSAAGGTVLTDSSMVVTAAIDGQGVALARWSLAFDDLEAGRLVRPFPHIAPMPSGRAYYLASTRDHLARPEVAAFRAWLLEEASALKLPRTRRARA